MASQLLLVHVWLLFFDFLENWSGQNRTGQTACYSHASCSVVVKKKTCCDFGHERFAGWMCSWFHSRAHYCVMGHGCRITIPLYAGHCHLVIWVIWYVQSLFPVKATMQLFTLTADNWNSPHLVPHGVHWLYLRIASNPAAAPSEKKAGMAGYEANTYHNSWWQNLAVIGIHKIVPAPPG